MFSLVLVLLDSTECAAIVRADNEADPYGSDNIERLNSELTCGDVARAPGRSLGNAAREHLIAQAAAVHVNAGGENPLRAEVCVSKVSQRT